MTGHLQMSDRGQEQGVRGLDRPTNPSTGCTRARAPLPWLGQEMTHTLCSSQNQYTMSQGSFNLILFLGIRNISAWNRLPKTAILPCLEPVVSGNFGFPLFFSDQGESLETGK